MRPRTVLLVVLVVVVLAGCVGGGDVEETDTAKDEPVPINPPVGFEHERFNGSLVNLQVVDGELAYSIVNSSGAYKIHGGSVVVSGDGIMTAQYYDGAWVYAVMTEVDDGKFETDLHYDDEVIMLGDSFIEELTRVDEGWAYILYEGNRSWSLFLDGERIGSSYDNVIDIASPGGQLAYLAEDGDDRVIVRGEEEIVRGDDLGFELLSWNGSVLYKKHEQTGGIRNETLVYRDNLIGAAYERIRHIVPAEQSLYYVGITGSTHTVSQYPAGELREFSRVDELYETEDGIAIKGSLPGYRAVRIYHGDDVYGENLERIGSFTVFNNSVAYFAEGLLRDEAPYLGYARDSPVHRDSIARIDYEHINGLVFHDGRLVFTARTDDYGYLVEEQCYGYHGYQLC